tara:strand:- start:67 stop:462 length:396 start_codon:yes stop_codon:yes gene_type:complete
VWGLAVLFRQSEFSDTHELRCALIESAPVLEELYETGELPDITLDEGEGQVVMRDAERVRLEYEAEPTIFSIRARTTLSEDEIVGVLYYDVFIDEREDPFRTFGHPSNVHQSVQQAGPVFVLCKRQGFSRG